MDVFFRKLHPLALQNAQFGFANFAGLIATLLFFMLLAISNDVSLRTLGTRSWKTMQRWIYVAFALTVAHGIAYQMIEKRRLPWVFLFLSLTTITIVFQTLGFLHTQRTTGQKPRK